MTIVTRLGMGALALISTTDGGLPALAAACALSLVSS